VSQGRPIATAPLPYPSPVKDPKGDPKGDPKADPKADAKDPKAAENPKKCSRCGNKYPADFLLCPRDGTPLELEGGVGDPLLGRVLDSNYQIVRLVGEGGMGRVYEARHLRLKERRLAIKILHPEFARDPEIVARFQREAESSSVISHPNVVDVYDVSKTPEGTPYMVAELLTGEEFGKRIDRGHLDPGVAVHIVRQVCRALGAAHAHQIVHRDMKPENVFLQEQDGGIAVKVIDFGISKVGEGGNQNLTKTGMVMGTPSYMAPEQARGDKVDSRADIYAVGAMLYHALTGKKPFDTDDPASTLTLVLTEEPERPRKFNSAIAEGLELVVQKAMAKDVRDRYQTMGELDVALAPFEALPLFDSRSTGSHTLVRRDGGGAIVSPTAASTDPSARTMMASLPGITGSVPTMITPAGEAAKYARPTVVAALLFLIVGLLAGLLDGIGGFVRFMHGGDKLSNVELVLIGVGVMAASATPIILYLARISKVWKNSVKTLEIATDLRRATISSFLAYGVAALAVRLTWMVILQEPGKLESGLVDGALFVGAVTIGLLAGGVGPAIRAWRKSRTEK
jgi:serine/threonine-protein kinase